MNSEIKTASGFKPYRTAVLGKLCSCDFIVILTDCPSVYRHAEALHESSRIKSGLILSVESWNPVLRRHGQTTNLIINFANEDWILNDDSATLASVGMGKFCQF